MINYVRILVLGAALLAPIGLNSVQAADADTTPPAGGYKPHHHMHPDGKQLTPAERAEKRAEWAEKRAERREHHEHHQHPAVALK
jgi:hypothetical protein